MTTCVRTLNGSSLRDRECKLRGDAAMDNSSKGLHISVIGVRKRNAWVDTNYRLYEEKSEESSDFWFHCETLSRS